MATVLFSRTKPDELFISINNTFFVYQIDEMGAAMRSHHTFNANVISVAQDTSTVFLCCDNDSLLIFDSEQARVEDEWTDFVDKVCAISCSGPASCFLAGTKNGQVTVFRPKTGGA